MRLAKGMPFQIWSSNRSIAIGASYLVGYVALDAISAVNELAPVGITPWNPPPGLSVALLLIFGLRFAPLLFVAAFLADLIVRSLAAHIFVTMASDLILAVGYTGLAMLLRRLGFSPQMQTVRDAAIFVTCGAGSAFVVSFLYVGLFTITGYVEEGGAVGALFRFWVGDAVGIIVFTPVLLFILSGQMRTIDAKRALSPGNIVKFLSMVFVQWAVYRGAYNTEFRFLYPLSLPMLWISVTNGLPGAITSNLLTQILTNLIMRITAQDSEIVTELQFALLAFSITSLLLGVVISSYRRAERVLADSEKRFRDMIDSSPDGVFTLDRHGTIRSVNPTLLALFERNEDQLVGRHVQALLPAFEIPADHSDATAETRVRTDSGRPIHAEVSLKTFETMSESLYVGVLRDITSRRTREGEQTFNRGILAAATRTRTTEELSVALAHELNHPLASAINYARAAQRYLRNLVPGSNPASEAMQKAIDQATRASTIIRGLRDFFMHGAIDARPTGINQIVVETTELLAPIIVAADAQLENALLSPETLVKVDKIQIQQVLVNLIQNSLDGVAGQGGAKLIRIGATVDGDKVVLEVADNGPGVSSEILSRLFAPFMTTKRTGLGLGLSMCKTIVEAHGGAFWLEETGPSGTRFRFSLPRHDS